MTRPAIDPTIIARIMGEPNPAISSLRSAADALGIAIDFTDLEAADRRFDALVADTRKWLSERKSA